MPASGLLLRGADAMMCAVGTRIGVVSDIHGDVHSLRDALGHLERMGCDAVWCAGDVVGTGGHFPEETIALVRSKGVTCIRGNHDRWAVGAGAPHDPHGGTSGELHDAMGLDLSAASLAWLVSLPTFVRIRVDDVRLYMTHGIPGNDVAFLRDDTPEAELRRHLADAAADVLIVGHTHQPMHRHVDGRHIVNPGAVARLQDDAAMVLDAVTGKWTRSEAPRGGTFGVLSLPEGRFEVFNLDGTKVNP